MKGLVFTEFVEMVEEVFSPELADRIIVASEVKSGGAYTAVGTYDHAELFALVGQLSKATGIAASDLVRDFGKRLFGKFVTAFPAFFVEPRSVFEFLDRVEDYIHIEVRKLYRDAELPTFRCERPGPDRFVMHYRSERPLAAFAEGLILGCVAHFGEKIELKAFDESGGAGTAARFELTREGAP